VNYTEFKRQYTVSDMSKEELFRLAFQKGVESADTKAGKTKDQLLGEISEIVSAAWRSGHGMGHCDMTSILRKLMRYDSFLIKCQYVRKYLK
jgi:hypothetical protein